MPPLSFWVIQRELVAVFYVPHSSGDRLDSLCYGAVYLLLVPRPNAGEGLSIGKQPSKLIKVVEIIKRLALNDELDVVPVFWGNGLFLDGVVRRQLPTVPQQQLTVMSCPADMEVDDQSAFVVVNMLGGTEHMPGNEVENLAGL